MTKFKTKALLVDFEPKKKLSVILMGSVLGVVDNFSHFGLKSSPFNNEL